MKSRTAFTTLLVVVSLSGCRFYGSAETVAGAKVEISNMLAWAGTEADRLAADREALQAGGHAASALALSDLEGRLAALKADWSDLAASVEASSSHRTVRHALSGMISERQRHEDAYVRVIAALGGTAAVHGARLSLEPTFWVRAAHRADRRGVRDVLQGG